jgi:hypothetical protein
LLASITGPALVFNLPGDPRLRRRPHGTGVPSGHCGVFRFPPVVFLGQAALVLRRAGLRHRVVHRGHGPRAARSRALKGAAARRARRCRGRLGPCRGRGGRRTQGLVETGPVSSGMAAAMLPDVDVLALTRLGLNEYPHRSVRWFRAEDLDTGCLLIVDGGPGSRRSCSTHRRCSARPCG